MGESSTPAQRRRVLVHGRPLAQPLVGVESPAQSYQGAVAVAQPRVATGQVEADVAVVPVLAGLPLDDPVRFGSWTFDPVD
jgi:hypothetical protein